MEEIANFALKLADIGRKNTMSYFRTPLEVDSKQDLSPVTIADRNVEQLLRTEIETTFPNHGIFGEEHGQENMDSPELWVLDPIDGTKSFITGMPTFGTLISFLKNGKSVVGVLEMPALKERWFGVEGLPTTLNGVECSVSSCAKLQDAILYTTSVDGFNTVEADLFEQVSQAAKLRRFGGDCYSYGLLASGFVDVVLESSLEPYDYLSLIPIVEGAGGVISDWQGNALTLHSSGQVLASATAQLHAEILQLIK